MDLYAQVKEAFGVEAKQYTLTTEVTKACVAAYKGTPAWEDAEAGVKSANFAQTLCEEIARLTWLGTSVKVEGKQGAFLQKIIDKRYYDLRTWGEYAMGYGTVIIKPNGRDYDVFMDGEFLVTDVYNREIWGAVFVVTEQVEKKWYTRLEWHRFENQIYKISNKCYEGYDKGNTTKEVSLSETPWKDLQKEYTADWATRPFFAVLRTPQANPYDTDSPLGLPIFARAMVELEDLDVAYSRFTEENYDSRRSILMDSDRLLPLNEAKDAKDQKKALKDKRMRLAGYNQSREAMGLPKYVHAVEGMGDGEIYHEINPTLNTSVRVQGINNILSIIGYKAGFANGYFVFDAVSGIQTATGVEANQQRTIQFVKDCRDRAEKMLDDLLYAIAGFAVAKQEITRGDYKATFNFGDITYNEDEDRARWLTYVSMGKIPFWYYLKKFEGMTEEEAKKLEEEAKPQLPDMFGGEGQPTGGQTAGAQKPRIPQEE